MLKVWIGQYIEDGVILGKSDYYFDKVFDRSLLLTDFSKRLIHECYQGSEVINECQLKHPWRGYYSPELLPTGVKTTLLAMYDDKVITNMLYCGDNCIPYIVEASRERDVTVVAERIVYWFSPYCRDGASEILLMNNNKIVTNFPDYFKCWAEFEESVNTCK